MKAVLYFVLLFIPITIFGQSSGKFPVNENGNIEYSEIVQVDSVSSGVLFARAKMYVAKAFYSMKDVLQNEDDNNKTLIIKANIKADVDFGIQKVPGEVPFTFIIMCKDNRFRYSIEPSHHQAHWRDGTDYSGGSLLNEKPACGTFKFPKKKWEQVKESTAFEFSRFIDDLKLSMKTRDSFNNNW